MSGFYNIEFFAPLKPFDEWPRGVTKEKLTDEINKELSEAFPGVVFNFSQYISDNVEEALSRREGRELGQGVRQRPREQREDRRARSST